MDLKSQKHPFFEQLKQNGDIVDYEIVSIDENSINVRYTPNSIPDFINIEISPMQQNSEYIVEEYEPESSFIKSVTYSYKKEISGSRISQIITFYFSDGGVIEYTPKLGTGDAPFSVEGLFYEIKEAPSVGKFWHKNIKNQYPYKKIR